MQILIGRNRRAWTEGAARADLGMQTIQPLSNRADRVYPDKATMEEVALHYNRISGGKVGVGVVRVGLDCRGRPLRGGMVAMACRWTWFVGIDNKGDGWWRRYAGKHRWKRLFLGGRRRRVGASSCTCW